MDMLQKLGQTFVGTQIHVGTLNCVGSTILLILIEQIQGVLAMDHSFDRVN